MQLDDPLDILREEQVNRLGSMVEEPKALCVVDSCKVTGDTPESGPVIAALLEQTGKLEVQEPNNETTFDLTTTTPGMSQ